jgi:hypothetical protein
VNLLTCVRRDLSYSSEKVRTRCTMDRRFGIAIYILIKQRGSIMWTRDEFVSYSFLLAVTVAGLGLLTLAFG